MYKRELSILPSQPTSEWKEQKLLCATCGVETNHRTLRHLETEDRYWLEDYDHDGKLVEHSSFAIWQTHEFVQCKGCDAISYQKTHQKNYGHSLEEVELYPPRLPELRKFEGAHLLPSPVRQVYEETWAALCNGLFALSGIGVRMLLEQVFVAAGVDGRTLKGNIDHLTRCGALSSKQAEPLHLLRSMGNDAAHEGSIPTLEQLGVALGIVEHLLRHFILLPASSQGFSDYRAR